MSLGKGLLILVLNCVILGIFLFVNNVYDDFFEIFVREPHVNFTQLFFGLVNLNVFDYVFVDQVVISRY